ncbi:hypothetical protein ASA1KI_20250 [Opitutales bacterium ASA1]|uniref:hypothetical protein n=1 Tax=Congregicoccus parvus TaxID=3081749 RepID=UPI002B2C8CA6|nr:hypothetical protein ASA1KI_20250 [Opitutales bacterium ASA1]
MRIAVIPESRSSVLARGAVVLSLAISAANFFPSADVNGAVTTSDLRALQRLADRKEVERQFDALVPLGATWNDIEALLDRRISAFHECSGEEMFRLLEDARHLRGVGFRDPETDCLDVAFTGQFDPAARYRLFANGLSQHVDAAFLLIAAKDAEETWRVVFRGVVNHERPSDPRPSREDHLARFRLYFPIGMTAEDFLFGLPDEVMTGEQLIGSLQSRTYLYGNGFRDAKSGQLDPAFTDRFALTRIYRLFSAQGFPLSGDNMLVVFEQDEAGLWRLVYHEIVDHLCI